jgi:hypothetical protein
MPDLNFQVETAAPVPYAAAPMLSFKLRITEGESDPGSPGGVAIQSIGLHCQIRIEPASRRYDPGEQDHLLDLFGQAHRWGQTLRSMLWAHASVSVPGFTGTTAVELPVPCTSDFNVAAAKYFYALENGEVPLTFLFSGTIFYTADAARLQVTQIPWEKEAGFRLPVRIWKDMMDLYYPNTAWLYLRKDVFDQLYQYKSHHGLPTWEQAIENLLASAQERVVP